MSDIDQLGRLFGTRAELARMLHRDPATFIRWNERHGGTVPIEYTHPILLLARDIIDQDAWDKKRYGPAEDWLERVKQCLSMPLCPHCKKPLATIT